jgi:hypothetical protein
MTWKDVSRFAIVAIGVMAGFDSIGAQSPVATDAVVIAPGTPLHHAMYLVARATGVPVGFESIGVASEKVVLEKPLTIPVSNPEQTIAILLAAKPGYTLSASKGALVIRPGAPRKSPLDIKVQDLRLGDTTLAEAARVLGRVERVPPNLLEAPSMRRRFSVRTSGLTAAEALTEVAVAHGQAAWSLVYFIDYFDSGPALYSRLEIFTFDGVRFGHEFPPYWAPWLYRAF